MNVGDVLSAVRDLADERDRAFIALKKIEDALRLPYPEHTKLCAITTELREAGFDPPAIFAPDALSQPADPPRVPLGPDGGGSP